ncbi:hypothetical protein HZB74_02345, partial [Candidatus Saccharibacteria bacterium]|nr:hypothetical protein [Candidatus Saccharibacteria bacterium]
KRITDQAEKAVDKAEKVASFFEKTTTSSAIIKIISNIGDSISKAGRKGKKDKEE